MATPITFTSGTLRLEGLLDLQPGEKGAVITHPHPQYGGDMYNSVVEIITRMYTQCGISTLRFNFRGSGNSEGSFNQGIGEAEDVNAAIGYLAQSGITSTDLAGYSFGSWVNSKINFKKHSIAQVIMVSPPLAFLEFDPGLSITCPLKAVTGSRDDYAPPDLLKTVIKKWNPDSILNVIEGADHFYMGYQEELESLLEGFITSG